MNDFRAIALAVGLVALEGCTQILDIRVFGNEADGSAASSGTGPDASLDGAPDATVGLPDGQATPEGQATEEGQNMPPSADGSMGEGVEGGGATCDTTSCPSGCCDGATCVAIADQSPQACGSGGNACGTCASGQACSNGSCSCGGAKCAGCCQGSQCVTATSSQACGSGGAQCSMCVAGQECAASGCVCDATSCPSGCCSGSTCIAYTGQSEMTCGTAGATCGPCSTGTRCSSAGQCTCDATSCPSGCCDTLGQCQSSSVPTCGVGGASCTACGTGNVCSNGACYVPVSVTARVFGPGSGSIASAAGLSCTAPCTSTVNVPLGASLMITASGGPHMWWSPTPGCSGATCSLTASAPLNLTVTFSGNNLVFFTSATHDGKFGGFAGADALCASAASSAGLPGTYVAWLSTAATSAASRLGNARGWVRTDGLPVADTIGDASGGLLGGQIFYPPARNEFGQPGPAEVGGFGADGVWTGSSALGTLETNYVPGTGQVPQNCSDFSTNSASVMGVAGHVEGGTFTWTVADADVCNEEASVYCFGIDLANPVTVTPVVGRGAFLSSGNMSPSAGVAAADTLCQSEASTAGLANPTHYLALLATTTTPALSRFNLAGPRWVRPDGIAIVEPGNDLTGALLAPISVRADGTWPPPVALVATGAVAPGEIAKPATTSSDCGDWSATTAGATENSGLGTDSSEFWLEYSPGDPCGSYPVYCLEN
jgi:hypothetical protein